MPQQKPINKDYVIQSLQLQLSEANMKIAERDSIITEYYHRIQELEKQLENKEGGATGV